MTEVKDKTRVKQVLVIRRDLKMRRGKEIAQGAHASMGFLTTRILRTLDSCNSPYAYMHDHERYWIKNGHRKIGCKVDTLEDIMEIKRLCDEAKIECHVVEDHGITEFHGVQTVTAVAIGPDYDELIDPITAAIKSLGLY